MQRGASATRPLSPTPRLEVTAPELGQPCPPCDRLGGRAPSIPLWEGSLGVGKGQRGCEEGAKPLGPRQQHRDACAPRGAAREKFLGWGGERGEERE